jgi:hypothetical protein
MFEDEKEGARAAGNRVDGNWERGGVAVDVEVA